MTNVDELIQRAANGEPVSDSELRSCAYAIEYLELDLTETQRVALRSLRKRLAQLDSPERADVDAIFAQNDRDQEELDQL